MSKQSKAWRVMVRRALEELGAEYDESGRVPAWTCIHIERLTDGTVTRYQLRPDLFPKKPPRNR